MNSIIDFDKSLLIAINDWNSPFFDQVMFFLSKISVWIPLYVIILAWYFFPKWYGKKSYVANNTFVPFWVFGVIGLFMTLLCFGLTDKISSIVKEIVQRPRPECEPSLEGVVRLLLPKGGAFGFFSGHACNSFGLALISALIIKKKWWTILIMFWAAIVSYSRMYLAKHYPLDILCGAIVGLIIAYGVYLLWKLIIRSINNHRKSKCSAL